jgi:hypothetical protein
MNRRLLLLPCCALIVACGGEEGTRSPDAAWADAARWEGATDGGVATQDTSERRDLSPMATAEAGPDGAAVVDARPGSDDARVDAGGAWLFSETFESHPAGMAPSGRYVLAQSPANSSYVRVDETYAASGRRSLKAHGEGGFFARYAQLGLEGTALPVQGNAVFGRMMVYFAKGPQSVHSYLVKATGPAAEGGMITLGYGLGGGDQLMANNNGPGCFDCTSTAKQTPMPIGRWVCLAWHFDGPNQQMRLWLDGRAIPELHITDPRWKAPTRFTRIDFGWESYILDGDAGRDVWLDDLVLDDQPVPCP